MDAQMPTNSERDERTGMAIPPRFGPRNWIDFARNPPSSWNTLTKPFPLAIFAGNCAAPMQTLLSFIVEQYGYLFVDPFTPVLLKMFGSKRDLCLKPDPTTVCRCEIWA